MTDEVSELALTTRNASVEDLVTRLHEQHARKVDVVAPATAIWAEGGLLALDGTVRTLTPDVVTMTAGVPAPRTCAIGGSLRSEASPPRTGSGCGRRGRAFRLQPERLAGRGQPSVSPNTLGSDDFLQLQLISCHVTDLQGNPWRSGMLSTRVAPSG
jgi:hypothetical protein